MISRKAFLSIFYYYSQAIVALVSFIFVARIYGPGQLGIIAICMTLASTALAFTDFGLSVSHQKLLSSNDNHSELNGFFLFAKIFLLSTSLLLTYYYFIQINKAWITSETMKLVFTTTILFVFVSGLSQSLKIIYGGLTKTAIQQTPSFVAEILNSVTKVFLALFSFSIVYVAFSNLVFAIVTLSWLLYYARSLNFKIPRFEIYKIYYPIALPLFLVGILYQINTNIDKLVLYNYFGESDLAIYVTGKRITEQISYFGMIISGVTFPYLSRFLARKISNVSGLSIQKLRNIYP